MILLNKTFTTPFGAIPFDQVKNEDFVPAFEEGIKLAQAEIDEITSNPDEPSFENTIVALDKSGRQLSQVSSVFFNLNSAETSEELQKIAQQVSPILTKHGNDVLLNQELFKRVKVVYENELDSLSTIEERRLLDKTYKRFARNGALLSEDKQKELREMNEKLALASLKFGENVLAESNAFEMLITEESDLAGLPESAKEAAKMTAKSKEKEGWLFTLDYPSYVPFVTYAENRALREKMFKAFSSKANKGNDLDNNAVVIEIANLRHLKAVLLGYTSHAEFILEERMAKTPGTVQGFLDELLDKSLPKAKEEFIELEAFAKAKGAELPLQRWDGAYYSEKLKKEKLSFDEEKLRPYFKLENVIDGVFEVSQKLYGLTYKENKEIPVYHEEVTAYEVYDEKGAFVSLFYADFFPRAGKRQGAWMTSYKGQWKENGENSRPHVSIVCNFTKPTETKPSLLTFNEVTTLFHEFGHALHGMLANTTYESMSGTNVSWDFVELPSQVLENWCYESECLDLFAKHYETGENIPSEYIEQIKASAKFQSGMFSLRQISFGLLDMGWHAVDPVTVTDPSQYERMVMSKTSLYPDVEGTNMSTQFSHIFQGGYSAGYYSYKWAEVLDADAFELFKEKGVFDKKTADDFKNYVLSQGGSEDPSVLYKKFRGAEPKVEALLKRSGLID